MTPILYQNPVIFVKSYTLTPCTLLQINVQGSFEASPYVTLPTGKISSNRPIFGYFSSDKHWL